MSGNNQAQRGISAGIGELQLGQEQQLEAIQSGIGAGVGALNAGQGQGLAAIQSAIQQGVDPFQSFLGAGQDAQGVQAALSGALGAEAQAQAFANFQDSPGQAFLQERGERAVTRNASATGGLGGGRVLQELQRKNGDGLRLIVGTYSIPIK